MSAVGWPVRVIGQVPLGVFKYGKEDDAMFVRGTRTQTPPDQLDEAVENFQKHVVPNLRSAPGFFGAVLLADRKSGSGIGITYWETAKALSASEQVGSQARTQAAENVAGTQIVNVERYEIVILERAHPPTPGEFARVNTIGGDTEKVDSATSFVSNKVLPVLKSLKGYRAIVMGVDRQTGRSTVSTLWDTLADLEASDSKLAGLRKEAARAAGADEIQVEIFETRVFDFRAATPSES
jgi:heme-degrading monooxygenase HmoA